MKYSGWKVFGYARLFLNIAYTACGFCVERVSSTSKDFLWHVVTEVSRLGIGPFTTLQDKVSSNLTLTSRLRLGE